MYTKRHTFSTASGQAAVEFALSVVILVLLLGATVDLGHSFYIDVTLHDAAREGARHGVWFDVAHASNPYLDPCDIMLAANDVLKQNQMAMNISGSSPTCTSPALDPGGTTCPTTGDGNAYDNPPYVSAAAPAAAGGVYMYVCYNYSQGQTYDQTSELEDVNVIFIHRLSFLEPYLPEQGFGSVVISENQHMAVQGD